MELGDEVIWLLILVEKAEVIDFFILLAYWELEVERLP